VSAPRNRHDLMITSNRLYAAKCYWPGVTAPDLERAASRATAETGAPRYLGSLLFEDDELVLCLFDATSRDAVRGTTRRAGLPCDRVMDSRWLPGGADRPPLPESEMS
jgi:hypothetical protein